ncbi:MAG: 2-hydroxychromene-2-carboxylate isomerase [Bradyrhizobium sp.]|uniref:2-hydroxychromene-2-carboxylate isomerase n=1 Tax=Bradyrhizobium sp. TaxID=376 RepID=UPI002715E1C9|nr:2-hydroxychromene-2-carboxylate isomerase [Bradyrhizobium sp.]MDO9564914.1 2-hydroxychromene-2-carboxylate isomerase [Bradyrhizobium sp.]MDP3690955.1 2-hydroxychromene-2-carboxylate isomerase [Bradyrhizobium sp.]
MTITVDYYMALTSPWTYLGCAPFEEIVRRHKVTVNIKPCKFGPIFEQTGGLPLPKRSPQRRAYRMMELKRWREVRDVPLILEPKYFPCDDGVGTRLLIAAKLQGKDTLKLSEELGRAVWEREETLADPDHVASAARRAGLDAAALRAGGPSDAELDALHEQYTREAVAAGVFGAPSYVLPSGEIFWGQDRLELLERALKRLTS